MPTLTADSYPIGRTLLSFFLALLTSLGNAGVIAYSNLYHGDLVAHPWVGWTMAGFSLVFAFCFLVLLCWLLSDPEGYFSKPDNRYGYLGALFLTAISGGLLWLLIRDTMDARKTTYLVSHVEELLFEDLDYTRGRGMEKTSGMISGKLVVIDADERKRSRLNGKLPEDWLASSLDEIEFVVLLRDESAEVGRYIGNGGASKPAIVRKCALSIVDVKQRAIVDQVSIDGGGLSQKISISSSGTGAPPSEKEILSVICSRFAR
jgi:hypothetical protein